MSKKIRRAAPAEKPIATATTEGAVQEEIAASAAGSVINQDDDLAGDVASAIATGDATGLIESGAVAVQALVADGEVVAAEGVSAPRPDGDVPGDAAANMVSGEGGLDFRDPDIDFSAINASINPPESERTGEAGNLASFSDGRKLPIDVHADWNAFDTEEKFKASYPRTFALISGHQEMTQPVLRITPKSPGFRRGGIAHPAGATDYPALSMSPIVIEALLDEPMLVIEIV